MQKVSGDGFHIGLLSFYDGTDPVDELVPDIVNDQHLVLSLLDLSFKIGLHVGVVGYGGERAHVKVFFKCPVGHGMYPGPSVNGRPGSMFKGHDTAITGQLFRVVIASKEVGENGKVECRDLSDPGNGSDQGNGLVEPVIGKDKFFYFRLNFLDLVVKVFVDTFEIVLGKFSKFFGEEFQFIWILVQVRPGVDELPSDLEQDLDLVQDFGHRNIGFKLSNVLKGILGNSNGIHPVGLSPLHPNALCDLDGHFNDKVGVFFNELGNDVETIDTCMFHTDQGIPKIDFLVPEQFDKGIGSFFGVFKYIRGSPPVLDDGHVKGTFGYIDTDEMGKVPLFHN